MTRKLRTLFDSLEPAARRPVCDKASNVSPLFDNVPLDRTTISQERLNIHDKVRSNLFPWNGQFSPQLVHALLEVYGRREDFVLDPFMGSGTVLVEAARLARRAFGSEINPAAYKMAQTYTFVNDSEPNRRTVIEQVDAAIHEAVGFGPLFSEHGALGRHATLQEGLLRIWARQITGTPPARLLETLIVLLDFYKLELSRRRILDTWRKLSRKILELPFSNAPVETSNCDARKIPIDTSMVDLVVTSPPYINVFNYHQQYRASAEAMGWNLLHVARSEIGSNRKHRGNRFLTVIQYCLDMFQALEEMRRVCKPTARLILVVGRESNVRKTPFYNGDIVVRIGTRCAGLSAEMRQERVFRNRFGAMIYEDIIHFRPGVLLAGMSPADVAREILTEALDCCPAESLADLREALVRITHVEASPLYCPALAIPRNADETANAAS